MLLRFTPLPRPTTLEHRTARSSGVAAVLSFLKGLKGLQGKVPDEATRRNRCASSACWPGCRLCGCGRARGCRASLRSQARKETSGRRRLVFLTQSGRLPLAPDVCAGGTRLWACGARWPTWWACCARRPRWAGVGSATRWSGSVEVLEGAAAKCVLGSTIVVN